jgi:hypothetical protein
MDNTIAQHLVEPRFETTLFIFAFLIFYVFYLARKTASNSIDLFDFVMLSTVGIVPALTVIFPYQTVALSKLIGVEFPFLILFGFLFFVVFAYLAYVISKVHKLQRSTRLLVQQVSLQNQIIEQKNQTTS